MSKLYTLLGSNARYSILKEMTLILTIVDDEKSAGEYYVAKTDKFTMKELEKLVSDILWRDSA